MNKKDYSILDPDDYNVNDYKIKDYIYFKDNNKLVEAIITDIDYKDGNVSIEFINK